jgi:hypothetical protein
VHAAYEIFSIDFPFSMIMKMEKQWKKFGMIMENGKTMEKIS